MTPACFTAKPRTLSANPERICRVSENKKYYNTGSMPRCQTAQFLILFRRLRLLEQVLLEKLLDDLREAHNAHTAFGDTAMPACARLVKGRSLRASLFSNVGRSVQPIIAP